MDGGMVLCVCLCLVVSPPAFLASPPTNVSSSHVPLCELEVLLCVCVCVCVQVCVCVCKCV